jgi:SAM-dependent methyltransferase
VGHREPNSAGVLIPAETIRSDFDQIAQFSGEGWNHNSAYHNFLLRQLPERLGRVLDIGCGTGEFTRLLAQRAGHVLGLDLSPEMIRLAWQRSQAFENIDYQVADLIEWEFKPGMYDCVVSIATLHHLPLLPALKIMSAALAPGGTLLALDLYRQATPADWLTNFATIPAHLFLKWLKAGGGCQSQAARAAWEQHGLHDSYLTLCTIRETCQNCLPGVQVQRRLLWRYSIFWKKPG